jgi:hypothetical protein
MSKHWHEQKKNPFLDALIPELFEFTQFDQSFILRYNFTYIEIVLLCFCTAPFLGFWTKISVEMFVDLSLS